MFSYFPCNLFLIFFVVPLFCWLHTGIFKWLILHANLFFPTLFPYIIQSSNYKYHLCAPNILCPDQTDHLNSKLTITTVYFTFQKNGLINLTKVIYSQSNFHFPNPKFSSILIFYHISQSIHPKCSNQKIPALIFSPSLSHSSQENMMMLHFKSDYFSLSTWLPSDLSWNLTE